MTHKELEEYILAKPGAWLDYPFEEGVAVYKVSSNDQSAEDADSKMFALIQEDKEPVRISLKCDSLLAQTLREKYETVMPGYHLNKKHWNTIVLSGQLGKEEILELIDHSYNLVTDYK